MLQPEILIVLKKLDIHRGSERSLFMYSKEERMTALKVLHQTNSLSETIAPSSNEVNELKAQMMEM